ncbi:MAG: FKBP-type peptidyl-prolyl cis-trans isomerase [Bdellovibrionales bacterium]|nr:FKBP-type peptidyl-prolyl cis-trans isomerase [Bdellovibrionales bacterium]
MKLRHIFTSTLVATGLLFFAGCSKCSQTPEGAKPKADAQKPDKPNYGGISVKRVVTRELGKGSGSKTVTKTSTIKYKQTTWIYDPKKPANKGQKVNGGDDKIEEVKIGTGNVIRGIEQGVLGMKKGGKRQLIIPAEHAYGQQGMPPHVFPGAILMTEIEIIDLM